MSIADFNTFCVEEVLCLSSDIDVYTFGEAFPEHQEVVNSVWTHRSEVNVDDVLPRDADKLLHLIAQRGYLKEITLKNTRPENNFSRVSSAIAGNCSMLEVLDIPGLRLLQEDVHLLRYCTTLKRINIRYSRKCLKFVKNLLVSNPQLEQVHLEGRVSDELFKCIPNTIRDLKFKCHFGQLGNSFVKYAQNWKKLERLNLPGLWTEKNIMSLSRLTTLKYLNINCMERGNSLELLFRNNPGLLEVHLNSIFDVVDCSCLKYLSPNLRVLKLHTKLNINADDFVEYVRTWKLEVLLLNRSDSINNSFIMRVLEAAPSLRHLHIDLSLLFERNLTNLQNFTYFEKLHVLHLQDLLPETSKVLKDVLENCLNLQQLTTSTKVYDSETFSVIGSLPKLSELCIDDRYTNFSVNYTNYMKDLCKSKSLKTVGFNSCYYTLNGEAISTLIRGCKSLKRLIFFACLDVEFNKDFLNHVVDALEQQPDRTQVLTVEIRFCRNVFKPPTERFHPMLNLEIINSSFAYDVTNNAVISPHGCS